MGNKIRTYAGRMSRRAAALVLSCLFFAGACTRDAGADAPAVQDERALVRLTVLASGPAQPGTRAADAESGISEVAVLVFEQTDGAYVYRYRAEGERLGTAGGNATQFQATLIRSDKPMKLMLAANYGDAFAAYAPAAGSGEAEVREGLCRSYSGMTAGLPMYGEIVLPDGLNASADNDFTVRMLRGVARADVVKELAADSAPFRFGALYIYRANDRIRMIPDDMGDPSAPKVAAPSVPSSAAPLAAPLKTLPADGADPASFEPVYLPEALSIADPVQQLTAATCLVVGGYYRDATELSYYRIDFDSGAAGHPFGQVLRNYKYVFRIIKVTGAGWPDPGSAATSESTGIVAEVEPWADFTTEMYFEGENYLGVSSRKSVVGYAAGSRDTLNVQATLPYTIQWLDASGTPSGSAVSGVGATVSKGSSFTASIVRKTNDPVDVTHLVFTALQKNTAAADLSATLRITGGSWSFDVRVVQEGVGKYAGRFIRVLSVAALGDLGATVPTTAQGRALRYILENPANFSPEGKVPIGGFAFVRTSASEMQATGTGGTADKGTFRGVKGLINAQDVVYLSYNTSISTELAQVVLAWLEGSTHRVLIVGTDTGGTNANLLTLLKAKGEGSWSYDITAIANMFKRAAPTAGSDPFFDGPFGAVAANATIARADGYAGYCSDYPASVVPLVVGDKTGYDRYMVVGVNTARRIVYLGDANLNEVGRLSTQANTDGTVSSDFDRLTANLWAWIAEQVVRNG